MSSELAGLFTPYTVKSLTLANRWVLAPMTRNQCPHYIPTPEVAAYYKRRAQHGVGLLITEATVVNHVASNGYEGVPAFFGEQALAGWKHVVDEVHSVGGKIIPQLWHVGTIRKEGIGPDPKVPGMGPSGITSAGKRKGHAMSESDIADVIEAFAQGAADAERLGFDGVEIHGAHGYLIDQFFWEVTNERTDRFGGSFEKRSQFAIEILRETRKRVAADFPVFLRFSQWKQQDYTARLCKTPAELEQFLLPLSDAGVDVFHASSRRFWEPEFEGSDLNLAGWAKKITGKPTITVGSVGLDTDFLVSVFGSHTGPVERRGLDELARRFNNGEFDMVGVGRALLQDPAWLEKVREQRLDEIKPFTRESVGVYY